MTKPRDGALIASIKDSDGLGTLSDAGAVALAERMLTVHERGLLRP